MPFSIDQKQDSHILTLAGAVTIRDAGSLAAALHDVVDDTTQLTVDTTDVADLDTCILQLLCSLRQSLPALSFGDPSEAFIVAVDRCGLRRELLSGLEAS